MKQLILIISLFIFQQTTAQSYQLLPDSCTSCLYLQSFNGGGSLSYQNYKLDPENDTLFMGNVYQRISFQYGQYGFPFQPFGFRQVGNKLYGVVNDSINEFLIMDFDAAIGDTIHNLYSEGIIYSARVINKDSIQVNNGVFHHYMNLEGVDASTSAFTPWSFTWNERGLCGVNMYEGYEEYAGGLVFNVPFHFYTISANYGFVHFCTTDPLYDNPPNVACQDCLPQFTSLNELDIDLIAISPNPVLNTLSIKSNNQLIEHIKIYSLIGEVLISQNVSGTELSIDVSQFPSGTYFVATESIGGISIKNFIKM